MVIYWGSPASWFFLRGGVVAWPVGAAADDAGPGASVGGVASLAALVNGTASLS